MSKRRKAFEKPLPEGWKPKFRDIVWVRSIPGTMGRLVSTATVMRVADDIVRLQFNYGGKVCQSQFLISDIRPIEEGA